MDWGKQLTLYGAPPNIRNQKHLDENGIPGLRRVRPSLATPTLIDPDSFLPYDLPYQETYTSESGTNSEVYVP